jgi:mono/diheme cytochrome c family protein
MLHANPIAAAAAALAFGAVGGGLGAGVGGTKGATPVSSTAYRDGHTRPRALAFNAEDGLLYVALSTSDEVAVVDPSAASPRLLARVRACGFPDAIAALPGGGALIACRFDAGLRRLRRDERGAWKVTTLPAGPEAGARGLAVAPGGAVAYVASPPVGGVKVVSLRRGGGIVETIATGLSPRALRIVPAGTLPKQKSPLLLVSNFIDHTVTVHAVGPDGRLDAAMQSIKTEAPVLDMTVAGTPPSLLLFTHEDRPLDRAHLSVEGLDSGVITLRAAVGGDPRGPNLPFDDPGPGKRTFVNLGDRAAPVIELANAAVGDAATIAVVGAGSDNLLVGPRADLGSGLAVDVGSNPSAVAALPGGRFVTADRLSDTLTFVADGMVAATLDVGVPDRPSAADRGELLFYSRELVPNNVATGPLSLYTCAACHDDGHIDGRRHPAKRNRFFSMTKGCRGLGTTAPYLSIGEPATIEGFADNIVTTHAQGAERGAEGFDRYSVVMRVRAGPAWELLSLSPEDVRAALVAYMVRIPPEPSPFVARSQRAFDRGQRAGLALFRERCAGCHQLVGDSAQPNRVPARDLERRLLAGEVALTDARLHAVGTPILGDGGNNPPSLRGVWEAAPYFSDGSARTLEDVVRRTDPDAPAVHSPANATRPPAFTAAERAALLAFLRAL